MRDSLYQRIMHILTVLLLLGMWLHLLIVWGRLPDQVPTHYNAAGEIDGWGGKGSLLLLPIMTTVTDVLLFVIEQFPQTWNTGVTVTPRNKAFVYRTCKDLLATLEMTMTGGFWLLTAGQFTGQSLPVWILGLFLGIIILPIVFFMIRLYRGSRR